MIKTLLNKVLKRFIKKKLIPKKIFTFYIDNSISVDEFISKFNSQILNDSKLYSANLKKEFNNQFDVSIRKKNISIELLYFIMRHFRPSLILETGVAYGFSSRVVLDNMPNTKNFKLFSSDFPNILNYHLMKNTGVMVKNHQKKNWIFLNKGDLSNLEVFKKKLKSKKIELFIYDSDKSYEGKTYAFETLKNHINKKTIIILDDIQDDSFFYDYVNSRKDLKKYIIKNENKYTGIILNH